MGAALSFSPRPHVCLLGDSTLDNASYTGGGPCVRQHVEHLMRSKFNGSCSLFALDGSVAADLVTSQLPKCQDYQSNLLFVSVGGNDGLRKLHVLKQHVQGTVEDALEQMNHVVQEFRASYEDMVEAVLKHAEEDGRAVVSLCTIYNPRVSKDMEKLGVSPEATHLGVALFNDVILQTARKHKLIVVELRALFTEPEDFANPIEPSAEGGKKMAKAVELVLDFIATHGKPSNTVLLP